MQKPKKTIITSKGDDKHFYAYQNGKTWDCLKIRGRFYLAKLFIGEGLRAIGEPLRRNDFTLIV